MVTWIIAAAAATLGLSWAGTTHDDRHDECGHRAGHDHAHQARMLDHDHAHRLVSGDQDQKYRCQICSSIYDPAEGDPKAGVKPGTSFADLPDDWTCPDCGATKADFEPMKD